MVWLSTSAETGRISSIKAPRLEWFDDKGPGPSRMNKCIQSQAGINATAWRLRSHSLVRHVAQPRAGGVRVS